MHVYFNIVGIKIPGYGLMIAAGVVLANLLMLPNTRKHGHTFDDTILLEAYVFLGAILGSKILYLLVSSRYIDWSRFFEPAYFNLLMSGGFVFYGGVIGGLLALFLAGRLHHIKVYGYIRDDICYVPLAHGFGRIGCFLAGCCYGIPYTGPGAVVFPENSFAPAGISLFPVQLLEAALLFVLSAVLYLLSRKGEKSRTVEAYLILYGVIRFGTEFLRGDPERGHFLALSTSQWISLALILAGALSLTLHRVKQGRTFASGKAECAGR